MTLIEMLKNTADRFGNKQAILFENESYTYKTLDAKSSNLCGSFIRFGSKKNS